MPSPLGAAIRARHLMVGAAVVVSMTAVAAPAAMSQREVEPAESHISPTLDDVALDGTEYLPIKAAYEDARNRRLAGEAELEERRDELAALDLARVEAERSADRAARRSASIERSLRALAVTSYLDGGESEEVGTLLDPAPTAHDDRARIILTRVVSDDRQAALRQAERMQARAERRLGEIEARVREVRDRIEAVTATVQGATEQERELEPAFEDARALATVVGTDLPLVALDAYVNAAEVVGFTDPGCGLTWPLLAGIGRVETGHGTFGGSTLAPDGLTSDRILGLQLNGTQSTAAIRDTDGGIFDGDPNYDRAVGPMQFIPSTWVRWSRDGDDDDKADPHQLYDAALAAAAYLCASGPVDTEAGQSRAIFSYNHSQSYVALVSRYVSEYRATGIV